MISVLTRCDRCKNRTETLHEPYEYCNVLCCKAYPKGIPAHEWGMNKECANGFRFEDNGEWPDLKE